MIFVKNKLITNPHGRKNIMNNKKKKLQMEMTESHPSCNSKNQQQIRPCKTFKIDIVSLK